jgi:hypothetical protein
MRSQNNFFVESSDMMYTKTILNKVSFDNLIFLKELRKSKRYLNEDELYGLKSWCKEQFCNVLYNFDEVL